MRITYRQLAQLILLMDENQLDSDVTAEVFDGENTESFAAELRIAGEDSALDENHPVLYVNQIKAPDDRVTNIEEHAVNIGLV